MTQSPENLILSQEQLSSLARTQGLQLYAWQPLPDLSKHGDRLRKWQLEGKAGQLQYMGYAASQYSDFQRLLPSAQSIISFAIAYPRQKLAPAPPGVGRIARYAWEEDYHLRLPRQINELLFELQKLLGQRCEGRIIVDAAPLLERGIAAEGGLGFFGKNTLLIRKKFGSFFFLAELLISLPAPKPIQREKESSGSCGTCSRCQSSCPTQALSEFSLDARKCISNLTIEKKGTFTSWERRAIGEWLFGCDICQEVCPFNAQAIQLALSKQYPFGPFLALEEVFSLQSQSQFEARFRGSAILRSRRSGLVRNALAVANNQNYTCLLPLLWKNLETERSPQILAELPHTLLSLSQQESLKEFLHAKKILTGHRHGSISFFREAVQDSLSEISIVEQPNVYPD